MANGQPGFGDSLFKLASQRQAALSAEQARKSNQDNLRRNDINTLSGFDAASIEGDQQRAIFEEAVADVQSYISGTGEYEDAEYDPVNFKKQLMKINSVYNGFKAHGAGDVKTAREALYNDAYTAGGVAREGGELGTNLMSNNNPSSYDESVANHNNYFETARTANGKTMFDENGHPMGYPVIDGEVDRSAAPTSLFKMNAYANPESFVGNTVEVPAATTLDMVQGEKYVATLNRINESLEGVEGKPLREVHDIAVSKLFDDKFSSAGQSEFRETLLIDLVKEGKFPSDDKELQQAFINGEFDNENLKAHIPGVRRDAEKIYADRSFDIAAQSAQATTRSGGSGPGTEDSPYASVQNRDLGKDDVGNVGGEYQLRMLKEAVVQEGSLFGDYSITGVGINGDGERIASITETTTTVDALGKETIVTTPPRELVISPEAGGLGREIYDSLRLQDPRILGDQHGDWINMNKARKEQLQAAQDEKAAKIKALKAEGKTPEEAQAIVDAGGEEAYNLQQREIALQPQIDNARSMLSGFDGGSFLRKFLADGMSPEAAKVQVDKARREAEAAGITDIKGITEAEKNQLLKDLDNKEMSNDPNAPGISVAEHASNIIQMKFNNQNTVPTEGDLDGDGQVGLVKGDDGYVAYGEPGYGYNEMEGEDSFGDPVKGYEAFWAQLGPRDKKVYTEPAEHKRKRLRFEADKALKSEVGKKPIEEVTPEAQAEYDATQEEIRLAELKEDIKAEEADEAEALDESSADVDELVKEQFTSEAQTKTPEIVNTAASVNTENVDVNSPPEEQATQMLTDTLNLNVPEEEMVPEIYEMFTNVIGPDTTNSWFDSAVLDQNLKGNPDVVPSWCAVYVSDLLLNADPNFELEEGFARVRAKTFLDVGKEVSMENNYNNAQLGDIVVKKGSGGYHVGLFAGVDENGDVRIFGANQNDSINVTSYPAQEIQGIRRVEARLLSENQLEAISTVTNANKNTTTT